MGEKNNIQKADIHYRKTGYYRELSIFLSVIIIFLIASACDSKQNTESIFEHQKELLKTIDTGEFVRIETPEHISEIFDKYPKLKITLDADVSVPETDTYPITEVRKRSFSDDDILSFIRLCVGEPNELYSTWDLPKNDWLQKLNEAEQYKDTGKFSQDYLDNLKKIYENAQPTVENPSVKIVDLPIDNTSIVYSKNKEVSRFLFDRNGNLFVYYRNMFLEVYSASMYEDNEFDEKYDTLEHFLWIKPGDPEISREEAYAIAIGYIDTMGIDLDIYYSEPCTVLVDQISKSTGWIFTFTRAISSLQAQYQDGQWAYVNPDAPPLYGAPWKQELCMIAVDKDGLCKLWWQGASEISKTLFGSAQLETFDKIISKTVDQLNRTYGTSEDSNVRSLDIIITKIELGSSLISDKDQTDIGIYLPTWYVSYRYKWSDEEDNEENWSETQIMLSAADGSYIEPRVTNSDFMDNDKASEKSGG